ncbi:putative leucine-rich repeat domain superfamily, transport inhibitor response 1 [Helianthus annuus]|nr:putative leucine-rich repeat domain superfamily, transport inhibitor response 1 [Helianthus annuus]
MPHLPESLLEIIINNLTSNLDRNSASLVNKQWYRIDRNTRRTVYVSNCHAVVPTRVIERFPNLRSLVLNGRSGVVYPRFVDNDWDGTVDPWVKVMSERCPMLEHLKLKRMVVSDQMLQMVSTCFRGFKSLVLCSCSGFTIVGLSAIASNCRNLERLEVERCAVVDHTGQWLRCFPETLSSLVSLNISCIRGLINPTDLSQLVARCPNLSTLSLRKTVSIDTVRRILMKSPQLVHLGVGCTLQNTQTSFLQLSLSLHNREPIQSLTFFHRIPTMLLHALYPVCSNLVFLNVRFAASLTIVELVNFIKKCTTLRRLWVRGDCIGDEGLEAVSNNCKNLEDLRVFQGGGGGIVVTEVGLTAISIGCQKLKKLTYCCSQMTNSALVTFSKNCPDITRFKLIISTPKHPDHTTLQPFDHGYGAIVESCKDLKKLTASGLLTNDVFLYIGMYAERLEVLSVPSGCESDAGIEYVFNGCKNLKKVEINTFSFLDDALSAHIYDY